MERIRVELRYPEFVKTSVFLASIPVEIEDLDRKVEEFNSKGYREGLENYANTIAKDLGLDEIQLAFSKRGLYSVTVAPLIMCPCMGVDGNAWDDSTRYPAFNTHNVDTPIQYLALTSTVFSYLNTLESMDRLNKLLKR